MTCSHYCCLLQSVLQSADKIPWEKKQAAGIEVTLDLCMCVSAACILGSVCMCSTMFLYLGGPRGFTLIKKKKMKDTNVCEDVFFSFQALYLGFKL